MDKVTSIGLDLAKTYFQVHGVDERGRTVVQPPPSEQLGSVLFPETLPLPGGHGSLCGGASLGA